MVQNGCDMAACACLQPAAALPVACAGRTVSSLLFAAFRKQLACARYPGAVVRAGKCQLLRQHAPLQHRLNAFSGTLDDTGGAARSRATCAAYYLSDQRVLPTGRPTACEHTWRVNRHFQVIVAFPGRARTAQPMAHERATRGAITAIPLSLPALPHSLLTDADFRHVAAPSVRRALWTTKQRQAA